MNSQLLDLELDTVAAYNSHGEALVAAIRQAEIPPMHHPVILGMFVVTSLLVSIGHFSDNDFLWPPYALEQFDPQKWLDAGLDAAVVSIIALLPYPNTHYNPNTGESWHLDPYAQPISYLGGPKFEMDSDHIKEYVAQRCYDFVGRDLIRPDHVRFTTGGFEQGNNYIYDTTTGKIMILNQYAWMYGGINKGDGSYTEAQDSFYPAQDIMRNWIRNLLDLIYIPWGLQTERPLKAVAFEYDLKNGEQLHPSRQKLSEYCNDPTWSEGFIYPNDLRSIETNFALALRNIYKTHGWPDRFDKEACWTALRQFNEEHEVLDDAVWQFRKLTPNMPGPYPGEEVPRAELLAFLEKTAGDLAIKRNTGRNEL